MKSIKCIGDTISLCKALHSFISKAAVHDRWTKIQELHKLMFMEIRLVSDTRWTCQAKQFDVVWKRLEVIIAVLTEVINYDKDDDRKIEASGYKLQIDRMFVRYLFAIRHILKRQSLHLICCRSRQAI